MLPDSTVVLDTPTVAAIEAECRAAAGVETGGLLLRAGGVGVATGPGPAAVRTPDRLEWDPAFIAARLAAAAELGAVLLGRWHKHTSPVILASAEDRTGAEALRGALGVAELADVIVACDDADRPIGWAAYLCSESGYERIQVQFPAGGATTAS